MGDRMNDLLQPDYDKGVIEVYANTTRHLILEAKSLNPICGQQLDGRREDLPSWVPDFHLDQDLAPASLVTAVLKTRGMCTGVVEHLSEVAQADESVSCLEKRCYAAVEGFCKDSGQKCSLKLQLYRSWSAITADTVT